MPRNEVADLTLELRAWAKQVNVYQYPGTRWYGKTKQREFMEAEAQVHRYRPAKRADSLLAMWALPAAAVRLKSRYEMIGPSQSFYIGYA